MLPSPREIPSSKSQAPNKSQISTTNRSLGFNSSLSLTHPLTRLLPRLPTPLPPQHQLQSGAIGVGPWHPFVEQLEMGREPLPQLFTRRAERRAVLIRDQVIDRQILAVRFEPPQDRPNVIIALVGLDRTEQRVL